MANTITIYRGDTETLDLSFNDGSNAIDITGYTVFLTVKLTTDTDADDLSALITKTVTSHTDPTNGKTQVVLTDSDTAIATGTHKYDIQTKSSTGDITTVVSGSFVVTDDVTKRTS